MAKLCKQMVEVLPYPNAGPEGAQLKAYMMEVLGPFFTRDDYLPNLLDAEIECYTRCANMLMLESTSWEWDYSHDRPAPSLVSK